MIPSDGRSWHSWGDKGTGGGEGPALDLQVWEGFPGVEASVLRPERPDVKELFLERGWGARNGPAR